MKLLFRQLKACLLLTIHHSGTDTILELRRSVRERKTDRLVKSLAAEKEDDDGNPIPTKMSAPGPRKVAHKSNPALLSSSDDEDDDFIASESSDDDSDCPSLVSLDHDEVYFVLVITSCTYYSSDCGNSAI